MVTDPPHSSSTETSFIFLTAHDKDPIVLHLHISIKLTRDNYLSWKSQITPLLHGHGLFKYLESDAPPPFLTTTDPIQINPSYLPWHKQDQLILGWIRSSLTEPLLAQVISCNTSHKLWSQLQQSFSATSRAQLVELRRQLQTTFKGGTSASDCIQKMRTIADELAFIGSPVSEDNLITHILSGFGPDLNSFLVAVTTKDHLTLFELQSLLLSHENLLKSQAPSSLPSVTNANAFYSTPRGNGFRPRFPGNNFNPNPFRPRSQSNPTRFYGPRFSQPFSTEQASSFTKPSSGFIPSPASV